MEFDFERIYHIAHSSAEFNRLKDQLTSVLNPWNLEYFGSLTDGGPSVYRVMMVFERKK